MHVQTRRDFLGHDKSSMFNLDNGNTDSVRACVRSRVCVV